LSLNQPFVTTEAQGDSTVSVTLEVSPASTKLVSALLLRFPFSSVAANLSLVNV